MDERLLCSTTLNQVVFTSSAVVEFTPLPFSFSSDHPRPPPATYRQVGGGYSTSRRAWGLFETAIGMGSFEKVCTFDDDGDCSSTCLKFHLAISTGFNNFNIVASAVIADSFCNPDFMGKFSDRCSIPMGFSYDDDDPTSPTWHRHIVLRPLHAAQESFGERRNDCNSMTSVLLRWSLRAR